MTQSKVDKAVSILWAEVVSVVNKVLAHAEIYGFQLMNLPDPNVHDIARTLESAILPIINKLIDEYDFSPESGIKMCNIGKVSEILRDIVNALNNEDIDTFHESVDRLKSEAMLCSE